MGCGATAIRHALHSRVPVLQYTCTANAVLSCLDRDIRVGRPHCARDKMGLFAKLLIAWGVVLDMALLFALPLLGRCEVMSELLKYSECTVPLSRFTTLICWLMAMCGCVRALAGLYPKERGVWYAAASSLLLEVA